MQRKQWRSRRGRGGGRKGKGRGLTCGAL